MISKRKEPQPVERKAHPKFIATNESMVTTKATNKVLSRRRGLVIMLPCNLRGNEVRSIVRLSELEANLHGFQRLISAKVGMVLAFCTEGSGTHS